MSGYSKDRPNVGADIAQDKQYGHMSEKALKILIENAKKYTVKEENSK